MRLSSCYFVGKPSSPDVPPLDDEDDDCEDDDKEGTGKIIACLPYHISVPLPDNRNFCDLMFNHGYGVGTLLTCDGSSVVVPYPNDSLTETQSVSECLMNNTEHNKERILNSTRPTVEHNMADDPMEHSVAHDTEHNTEHTHALESTTPTVVGDSMEYSVQHDTDNTQEYTTEHSLEQSVVENTKDTARHTKCNPQLSINEYLQLCVEHLNFSENDIMFAKYLYDTICHAGVMGVPLPQLEQVCFVLLF